jgi:hypothetical protein
MSAQNAATTNWIRAGLLALPLYGLLTFATTFDAQPDQVKHPEAWARYVSSTSYLVTHMLAATGGTILAIFGVFALGAYLATSRSGRLGLAAMVTAAAGHALLMVPSVISTFATPAIAEAYLSGMKDVVTGVEFHPAMMITYLLGLFLAFVGNVLLGVAVWRSGTLPKWAGAIWAASIPTFYLLGALLGIVTTGGSLLTQPVGALLMAIGGGWIALSAMTIIYLLGLFLAFVGNVLLGVDRLKRHAPALPRRGGERPSPTERAITDRLLIAVRSHRSQGDPELPT